jgi:hypothetical protein
MAGVVDGKQVRCARAAASACVRAASVRAAPPADAATRENRRDEQGGWQAASGVNGLGSNALYFGLYS